MRNGGSMLALYASHFVALIPVEWIPQMVASTGNPTLAIPEYNYL
jgi:hypothetical protein